MYTHLSPLACAAVLSKPMFLTLLVSSSQIEDVVHFVYVAKRPGVDEFLVEMAKHYEIVIYTASLNKYADPLLDLLDPKRVIRTRLFRESCVYYEGNYVKDLSLLDRDPKDMIIIDNSPSSYQFHPENAIDCSSFIDDPRDRELDQIGAFLAGIKDIDDVRGMAPQWKDWPALDTSGQILHKAPLR
jgi:RNA polymerase II subunit A small phosphatase-like protein